MPLIIDGDYSGFQAKLIKTAFANIHRCSNGQSRHVSIVARRNKIICVGVNNEFTTHPLSQSHARTIHSELHAIVKFPYIARELYKYTLFNIRIDRHNRICNSRPCKPCQNLLAAYAIGRVYYTDAEGIFQEFKAA
jgi:deoxycytidylate deaminase